MARRTIPVEVFRDSQGLPTCGLSYKALRETHPPTVSCKFCHTVECKDYCGAGYFSKLNPDDQGNLRPVPGCPVWGPDSKEA